MQGVAAARSPRPNPARTPLACSKLLSDSGFEWQTRLLRSESPAAPGPLGNLAIRCWLAGPVTWVCSSGRVSYSEVSCALRVRPDGAERAARQPGNVHQPANCPQRCAGGGGTDQKFFLATQVSATSRSHSLQKQRSCELRYCDFCPHRQCLSCQSQERRLKRQ